MKLSELIKELNDTADYLKLSAEDVDVKIAGLDYDFFEIQSVYPTLIGKPHIIIEIE
ncbi:MAG: hypothetical protein WC343_05360 [Bacilli bacterium]|jgi:hypothetical protein